MSRLIVKAKYYNPAKRSKSLGGYAQYIATREGVEKRAQIPERSDEKTYADYIATRPRVEKRGDHGLFSINDKPIVLKQVSDELKDYPGNVWTVIISLKREEAEALSYANSEAWHLLLCHKKDDIAKCFNIPTSELNCYAAFHDEGMHPHIHMIVYSKTPAVYPGKFFENDLEELKSVFAGEIFESELQEIYQKNTEVRDEIRERSKDLISRINASDSGNAVIASKLLDLSQTLSTVSGKKVYAYLPADVKAKVDDIVKELGQDESFSELYDLWYALKDKQTEIYNSKRERIPLEKNDEFKSIRNFVIREAINLNQKQGEKVLSPEEISAGKFSSATEDNSDKSHKSEPKADAAMLASRKLKHSAAMMFDHKIEDSREKQVHMITERKDLEQQAEVDEALGIKHG